MARICPGCGRVIVSGSCPRCRPRPKPSKSTFRRSPEQERERKKSNPWRVHYSSAAYKANCQKVLERYDGCCAMTGARIAVKVKGRWKILNGKGGIHHIKPLSQGGTDDVLNLIPLSVRAHNRIEAERRRKDRNE